MSDDDRCYAATPAETLEQHITDSRVAKNDAEWWAHREIERLREELEKTKRFYIEAGLELRQLREDNKRLEAEKAVWQGVQQGTADVVKQLEAEVATLRAALKPFADKIDYCTGTKDSDYMDAVFQLGEVRAAAAALKETGDG